MSGDSERMERLAVALERIADALETGAAAAEVRDREFASFAGMIHSDLETMMYAHLFAIPPLIEAQPHIDADAKVELIQRIFELSQVHARQVKEASGWRKPEDDA